MSFIPRATGGIDLADSRIHLYHNLSVMLAAGVPIMRSLQSVKKQGGIGRLFTKISQAVSGGQSLTEAIQHHGKQLLPLDRVLIEVGEQTGQLAEMFEALSQWYAFRQRLTRGMRSGMVLPLLYIHATAFIVPMIACAFSEFNPWVYVRGVVGILGLFYIPAAIILAVVFWTPKHGPLRWLLDRFMLFVPLLGSAIRDLELGRFSRVFAITYKAGIPIVRCAELATDSLRNQSVRKKLLGALEQVRSGEEMSTGFSESLPGEFLGIWQTGEESGDLDDAAERLGEIYADNAERKFSTLAQWTPRLIYGIVCLVMIYYVFKGYSQIFSRIYSF